MVYLDLYKPLEVLGDFHLIKVKILNLDIDKKPTIEIVNQAYIKIQKKIHPDISPETSRLSALVNEAKEIVIKDIS